MSHYGFSSDTQNPNPNPNSKLGRSDVLCIISYRRVLILNMDEILSGEDYKDGTDRINVDQHHINHYSGFSYPYIYI